MPFQVSPGVNFSEIDLTTIVPAVSTTDAGIAGIFRWGPLNKRVLIGEENSLASKFGKPTNLNAETWFTAASFLAYADSLWVVRVGNTSSTDVNVGTHTAYVNTGSVTNVLAHIVQNDVDYLNKDGTFQSSLMYVAKYPGDLGNSLKISICDSANSFASNLSLANVTVTGNLSVNIGSNTATALFGFTGGGVIADANTMATSLINSLTVGDLIKFGNSTIGTQYIKVTSVPATPTTNSTIASVSIGLQDVMRLAYDQTSNTVQRFWEFYDVVDIAPGQTSYQASFGNTSANDELHIVIADNRGKFTGVPGTVLEVFKGMSRGTDAKTLDGGINYYKTIINDVSKYVWFCNDRSNATSNTVLNLASSTNSKPFSQAFVGGNDGADESNTSVASLSFGYDFFASAEDLDISLILQGKPRGGSAGGQLGNYIIDNICERRKDCVVFISPEKSDVVNAVGNEMQNIIDFRNTLRSSSYGFLDSGYKYMYDKYNDLYRYVPLNGDIAGLCVRTDNTNDAWWSPAGFNRGNIKNLVRLAYNPKKFERDQLYKSGINPVVSFPGQGTVLYGDKTLQSKPSAFDRINVRRLFIVLEKAISTAAKYTLFEFNDDFTRAQFRNLINPYLRDVQGRRGITDFLVVCDDSNNTGEVIDRNEFIGDIYIKPARSINFIQLNFVAVRTDVQFSEIVGQF